MANIELLPNPDGFYEAADSAANLWSEVRKESVCDWVEENVELPTGQITGKVQLSYIPYAREILERYGNKDTRHLVMVFPTQAAKTTILSAGMLYRISRDPEDAMWVFGNADQANSFSKERWHPFVQMCQPVWDLTPRTSKGTINKHLFGFTNQHFLSMVLNFVGAGSTTNLASRPRGLIQMDECDKYYDELKFDAGTIQLAEERQKTFNFPLSVKASSPTLATRMIWTEYQKTDQRRYWIPCPRCGKKIVFKLKILHPKFGECGLRWWHEHPDEAKTDGSWDMKKVKANAFYRPDCCGKMIHSFERQDMLEEGEWKPDNPRAESGRFGYHLNSLYSILSPQTSFAQIAVQFLTAKGLRSELQNFINGWMAEPWDESQAYEHKDIKLEVFSNRDIPKDDSVPLMSIDIQENGMWVLVRRFARPSKERPYGESWLLFADWVQTEAECDEIQEKYGVLGENVTADMAHRPNQVGKMIIEHDWRGIWGSPNTKKFIHPGPNNTKIERPYSVVKFRDPMLGTAWENRTFERARYVNFSKDAALDLVSSLRYAEPTIWHITVNVSNQYSRHLNSRVKRLQKNQRTGHAEWTWRELHQQNHLADCESHVAIRAMQLGLIVPPPESEEQNVA